MRRYAEKTRVPEERSRGEIEAILRKHGAMAFSYGWKENSAVLQFALQDRHIRFLLPLPSPDDKRFRTTPTGRLKRNPVAVSKEWEQERRSRWRALTLAIKAKLQSSADGIETVEEAFCAQIVVPGTRGQTTVGELLKPQLDQIYAGGKAGLLMLPGVKD